jgi:hypothetical protein
MKGLPVVGGKGTTWFVGGTLRVIASQSLHTLVATYPHILHNGPARDNLFTSIAVRITVSPQSWQSPQIVVANSSSPAHHTTSCSIQSLHIRHVPPAPMLVRWPAVAYAVHMVNIARAAIQTSNTTAQPVSVITGVPTITQVTSVASPTAPLTAVLPAQVPLPPRQAWCPNEIFCPGAVRQISFLLSTLLDCLPPFFPLFDAHMTIIHVHCNELDSANCQHR